MRNPSDKPQSFTIDARDAFELPSGAPASYWMHHVYDPSADDIELRGGTPHAFELKPFEVLTLQSRSSR